MKDTPIMMKTDMIIGYVQHGKSQTRRTRGLDIINENPGDWQYKGQTEKENKFCLYNWRRQEYLYLKSPYGIAGDKLWFRETFEFIGESGFNDPPENPTDYLYKADGYEPVFKWSPSIHMPKEAARFRPSVIEVRLERLLDISEEDAIAEGITGGYTDDGYTWTDYTNDEKTYEDPRSSYMTLWDSINGKDSHRLNPWVWVIEFERIKK